MQSRAFLAALITALIVPVLALAAPPGNVTGLRLEPADNGIELLWDKLDDSSVAYYEIHYTDKAPTETDQYDQYVQTDGPVGKYLFTDLTEGEMYYASVIAVNNGGEKSTDFQEEVVFTFTGTGSADDPALPPIPTDLPLTPPTYPTQIPDFDDIDTSNLPELPTVDDTVTLGDASSDIIILDDSENPVAVDSQGQNSSITVVQQQPTQQPDFADQFEGNLMLLGARALSPNRVALEFSHFIKISNEAAPAAFRIVDSENNELKIKALSIDQADVILETVTQEAGKAYRVQVSEPLIGVPNLPLDPISREVFFAGHKDGGNAPAIPNETDEPAEPDLVPQDVSSLSLQATPRPDGLYDIEIQWVPNGNPAWYIVRQTRDNGQFFSPPSRLPSTFGGAKFDGVTAGQFGVTVQTLGSQGAQSNGMIVNVVLPFNNASGNPIYASGGPFDISNGQIDDDIDPLPPLTETGTITNPPVQPENPFPNGVPPNKCIREPETLRFLCGPTAPAGNALCWNDPLSGQEQCAPQPPLTLPANLLYTPIMVGNPGVTPGAGPGITVALTGSGALFGWLRSRKKRR